MTAEEYLCEEWNCDPADLELVHVATLEVTMAQYGAVDREGIDALVVGIPMVRRAVLNARIPEEA